MNQDRLRAVSLMVPVEHDALVQLERFTGVPEHRCSHTRQPCRWVPVDGVGSLVGALVMADDENAVRAARSIAAAVGPALGTVMADPHLSSWVARIEEHLTHPQARARIERDQVTPTAVTVSGVLGDRDCCWGTDEVTEGPSGRRGRCGRCLEPLPVTTWTRLPLRHVDIDIPCFDGAAAAPTWRRVSGWAVPDPKTVAGWANDDLAELTESRRSFAAERAHDVLRRLTALLVDDGTGSRFSLDEDELRSWAHRYWPRGSTAQYETEPADNEVWVMADYYRRGRLTVGHWVNPTGERVWLETGHIAGVDPVRMAELWLDAELNAVADVEGLDGEALAELWANTAGDGLWLPEWICDDATAGRVRGRYADDPPTRVGGLSL